MTISAQTFDEHKRDLWGMVDPMTFGVITLLLTFVGLLACWIPARRAMRLDPMIALRYE